MDTTYVSIMLVVFLVLAALAVNIGYLYVDEDEMRNVAELSALAGTQTIKKRMLAQLQTAPAELASVSGDTVQSAARGVAGEQALGKHKESALTHALNNDSNKLTTSNDMTVGFWNVSTHTYTPGGVPANAMQVRIRRTAESEATGIGRLGSIVGIISGVQKFDYTPDAIAALPAKANAGFALCAETCGGSCSFPAVCSVPERRMVSEPGGSGTNVPGGGNAYFMYQLNTAVNLSDMVCAGVSAHDVCSKEILTSLDPLESALRDMESMMYNPNVDAANKEYDKATGKLQGWWVIAPVTDCQKVRKEASLKVQRVIKYALVRISRICAPGPAGCQQNNTSFESPAAVCGADRGLFIDRISCVNCGSKALLTFPGLQPELVK